MMHPRSMLRGLVIGAVALLSACAPLRSLATFPVPPPAAVPNVERAQVMLTCMPAAAWRARLASINETRVAVGIVRGGGSIFELYASATGSWSLLLMGTGGESCMALFGTNYAGGKDV